MEKIEETIKTGGESFAKKERIALSIETISEKQSEEIEKSDDAKLLKARDVVDALDASNLEKSPQTIQQEIQGYIEKYIPEHLQSAESSLVYKIFKKISQLAVKEVRGKENLSNNSKLFISNHRGGESGRLIAALDRPVHIVAAETINWENGEAFQWILKKLGMVPVKETLSNLSEQQKERVVEKSPASEKEAHQKIAFEKSVMGGGNIKNIKAMVALLLRGDDVAIFSEGPFSRLEDDERKSYAGYALVAREYKRISGKDLEIIPTGIGKSKVAFGEKFYIDQNGKQAKEELQNLATEKIHKLYNSLS